MSELEHAEIIVGREDWERFLSSMERLMSLHEKTLQRQRELTARSEVLRKELRDALRQPSLPRLNDWRKEYGGRGLAERLLEWLKPIHAEPRASPNQVLNFRCGACGCEIIKPSISCERCGVSFGGLYCRCGRQLLPNDKFCDGCGLTISREPSVEQTKA